jgi:tetratricopeptide (TPR) repeat protein
MDELANSFEQMSESFKKAFGYANHGFYKQSIKLYEQALEEDKKNFAALNNMAIAKIYVGIQKKDRALVEEAMENLREAIRITKDDYKFDDGYPIAEDNLKWAELEISKLTV